MSETKAITPVVDSQIERVMIDGDLNSLTPAQRVNYYRAVCDSLGLNPLTKPFAYIKLNGKLTLYALRDAADQLRKLHGISIDKPTIEFVDDLVMVTVTGRDKTGRTDSDLGVVPIGNLHGDKKANAILKAITKAKRRLTLSIVGLGWLDETEIETIPEAEIVEPEDIPDNGNNSDHWIEDERVRKRFWAWATGDGENSLGLTNDEVHIALGVEHVAEFEGTMQDAKDQILTWIDDQANREQAEAVEEFAL